MKKSIKVPIYDFMTFKLLTKEHTKEFEEHLDGSWGITVHKGSHVYICLAEGCNLAHLHHEVVHASHVILESVGAKPSFDNDEAEAYLSSFLFKKCLDWLGVSADLKI